MFNLPFLMPAPEGASPGGNWTSMVMIVGVFAVFYLLIIRPQRKKQKDEAKMREAIKKGDRVTSIGGIRGTVKNVTDSTVIVEIDNKGNTLEFTKNAIGTVEPVGDSYPAKDEAAEKKPAKKSKTKKDESEESSETK